MSNQETINPATPVRDEFNRLVTSFVDAAGHPPTHCYLSLNVARRAAREHDGSAPMFQQWNPFMEFVVLPDGPDDLIQVTAAD